MPQSRTLQPEPEEFERLYREWCSANTLETPALEPLLEASSAVLRAVIFRKLGGSAPAEDLEDICSEALLEVIARLDSVRTGEPAPIERFAGYVASIGYRAVYDYFRSRHPERHKLKNRLRYALKPEHGFALWDAGEDGWLASLERYRRQRPGSIPEDLRLRPGSSLSEMAAAILDAAHAPVSFETLVSRIAGISGIRDQQVALNDIPAADAGSPFDFPASWMAHLAHLWQAIASLPLPQRIALLLNLQGHEGDSPLSLFPATGTASIDEIADMLEIPALEIAALWSRLPLGDREIAERLGLTRQQVINLRMSARKKLSRNLPEVIRQLREQQ